MDILTETIIDNLKLFPFLFLTYLFLEYMEHKTSEKTEEFIRKAGFSGPIIGALCATVPQCGFAAVAANFFAARVISMGTLIAVFLATSDEMLPILIAGSATPQFITQVLLYKAVCGIVFGYLVNFIWHKYHQRAPMDIENLCEHEHCHCELGIVRPALYHTLQICLFIFVITLALNYAIEYMNISRFTSYLQIPLFGELFSILLGLIPNCSSSVILTQLYLENYINIGTLMSGSLVSSGVGVLVLLRINRNTKENLLIIAILCGCGILGGLLSNLIL